MQLSKEFKLKLHIHNIVYYTVWDISTGSLFPYLYDYQSIPTLFIGYFIICAMHCTWVWVTCEFEFLSAFDLLYWYHLFQLIDRNPKQGQSKHSHSKNVKPSSLTDHSEVSCGDKRWSWPVLDHVQVSSFISESCNSQLLFMLFAHLRK